MASTTQLSDRHGSLSLRIRGGVDAPGRARRWVPSQLESNIAQSTASDVGSAVSELVTNSVLHANVDPRRTLTVECMTLDDRRRISVIDPGSRFEPRICPPDPERVGAMGLFIVNQLSEAWGVARDGTRATRVWCDILVHRPRSSQLRVVDSESAGMAPS